MPAQSFTRESPPSLAVGFWTSLILHSLILLLIVLKGLFFPSEVEIYIPSLRVDIVDLPDVLKKDLNQIQPKKKESAPEKEAPKAGAPTKTEEMALKEKAVKEKKKSKKEKLKELEAKKKKVLEKLKALESVQEEKESQIVKGNIVSPGTALTGDARESAQARYEDGVLERVKSNWELPIWIARQNLSAQILVQIDWQGRVIRTTFRKKSGNPQFDDAVLNAIKNSEPFPAPSSDIAPRLLSDGFLLGFPL